MLSPKDMSGAVIFIVGPTAVGKTALSLELAGRLNGEIINTDSMQLYRGLDIGTAKLKPGEQRGVRHHLLDVWDLQHPASVAEFQELARNAIRDVQSRQRTPILVGGSGLYVSSVIDDLQFPGTDPLIRAALERRLRDEGTSPLFAELVARDPQAAAKIEANNGRRIVRALEVIELTGEKFNAELPNDRPFLAAVGVGLTIDRVALDARIGRRVDVMWEQGFVQEVRSLLERGLARAPTARKALGYNQIIAMLDGELTTEEAKQATIVGTRRFSRRQWAWFRRDSRVAWVETGDVEKVAEELCGRALAQFAVGPEWPAK